MRQALMKKLVRGRVIFLGLDAAGKTTLIQQLHRYSAIDEDDSVRSVRSDATMLQSGSSMGDLATMDDGERVICIPKIYPEPTKNVNCVTHRLESDAYIQLVDVPGGRAHRTKWRGAIIGDPVTNPRSTEVQMNSLNTSNIPIVGIVFVVDATDVVRFPLVALELVRFQKFKEMSPPPSLQRAPSFIVMNKVDYAGGKSRQTQDHRRASRAMRQELKKAFDYQLRMDQRRHPRDYTVPSVGDASKNGASSSNGTHSQPSHASMMAKKNAVVEANNNRKVVLMTSLIECSAFDRDCVRSLHASIREEIHKLWYA